MNILFLLKSFEVGGLEVVTATLANKFHAEGHGVVLWAFYEGKTTLADRLDDGIILHYAHGFKTSNENVRDLRQTLIDNKIDVVINQWGLPFVPAHTLKKASRGLKLKIFAVYHNDPSTNGRLKDVEIALTKTQNPLKAAVLHLKHWLYKQVTSASMRYIYRNSDRFVVLSESFIDGFKAFTHIKTADKLTVITNPVTIDISDYTLDLEKKQKEVVYVGRVDYNQKRVSRIIETWSLLEHQHPDWTLRIIGDGAERENVEQLANTLGLQHVRFEGFQYPRPYYEKASLLVLTSEYEGFGLVIVEAMSFGVVPVVLGSYSAIYDILQSGKDGVIVPYAPEKGFDASKMAKELDRLMSNETLREDMAKAAYEKSRLFSIDSISSKWNELLKNVIGGGNLLKAKNSIYCKQKEIIYVGRLDYNQKRVFRIILTWALLEHRFPDWKLTIVGDGVERDNLERLTNDLALLHVTFEGFKHPKEYYERASVLMLTSDFEGFPLVLAECMSFGVVPVVYNSYAAVGDIIEDGKDGLILPFHNDGYQPEEAAEMVANVLSDDILRQQLALAAVEKSKNYSIDSIYEEWMQMFKKV